MEPIPTTILTARPDQYQVMLNNYSSIVEKTNDQLSSWVSMGSFAVGILSGFIGIIAIGVGYALYRNSKEQKDKFEAFLISQKKQAAEQFKAFEESAKKGREDADKKLTELIKENKQKLKTATADNKKDIQNAINNLEKEKAAIGARITTPQFSTAQSVNYPIGSFRSLAIDDYVPGTEVGSVASRLGDSASVTLRACVCGMLINPMQTYCTYCGRRNSTKLY